MPGAFAVASCSASSVIPRLGSRERSVEPVLTGSEDTRREHRRHRNAGMFLLKTFTRSGMVSVWPEMAAGPTAAELTHAARVQRMMPYSSPT